MKPLFALLCLSFGVAIAHAEPATPPSSSPAPVVTPDQPSPSEGVVKKARWEKQFKKLDANADGFLSKDEFSAGRFAKKHADKAVKRFSRWDKDHDTRLSKEEWINRPVKGKKTAI